MIVGQNYFSKSSFLSTDKDLSLIVKKIMSNQRLLKMLYYTQKDCLNGKDLTESQIISMLDKQIRIVPKIEISQECPNYIVITFNNFTPNKKNPEFRDFNISIDILCHTGHWNLGNFQLRPHKIAGEIDAMLNDQKLTGIGTLTFMGADNLLLNDELIGLTLMYKAIHGVEDKINPLS